jgi:hypothetical protein
MDLEQRIEEFLEETSGDAGGWNTTNLLKFASSLLVLLEEVHDDGYNLGVSHARDPRIDINDIDDDI